MPTTYPERVSLAAARMAHGAGVTCLPVDNADVILEKLPTAHLAGSELLPEAARTVESWHTWTGDDFKTAYGL